MENRSGNATKEVLYKFPLITLLEEHIPPRQCPADRAT
jgi:hypothetical protein